MYVMYVIYTCKQAHKVLLICRSWGRGDLCALQSPEAMPAGDLTPGRYNHAGQAVG